MSDSPGAAEGQGGAPPAGQPPTTADEQYPLVGYADPWSVAPGETVRFMVGTEADSYRAGIVRLRHGDDRPGAPGLKEEPVTTDVDGEYPGRPASYPSGSCVVVQDGQELDLERFTLAAWVFPTTPDAGAQGLLTRWDAGRSAGYGMVIATDGSLGLWLGSPDGERMTPSTGCALVPNRWYFLAASYEPDQSSVLLLQRPSPAWPVGESHVTLTREAELNHPPTSDSPFVMAAWSTGNGVSPGDMSGHFNGKLEAPVVYGAALGAETLVALADGAAPADLGPLVAAWDLAVDTPTARVRDVSGNDLDGRALNLPTRGMTGHGFRGGDPSWLRAPETHGAIHFHEDDLEDCGWEVAFQLTVPATMASGVYAAKLETDDDGYHVPFFVRPEGRRASAPILFLAPTNSYLAYANFQEAFAQRHDVLGLYHEHSDGSAVVYSSARRPIVNLRPGSDFPVLGEDGAPHQFNADLYLVDWLAEKGFEFDVATDGDLHQEGVALLEQYRVVLTGSHPEYWSETMLDALESYLGGGGRLMYLGGNGLIWNAIRDPERPHVVEVRRGIGNPRYARPGESHHSITGEQGGPWRVRGRPPNQLLGVGSIAQGFDHSAPYRRQPDASDPRASWIFDGVDDDVIGDFGLTMGGAAGFEVDCVDPDYGTPPHTLIVASATEFSPTYEHQYPQHVAGTDIDRHGPMRADMVYFETPEGGAVFSVGSIAYCGALSHGGYDNNVSRITENVLRRFSDPTWSSS